MRLNMEFFCIDSRCHTTLAVQSTAGSHPILAWPSPVRPMRVNQVGAETRALRRTSRVGPWADPVPAIHGGLDKLQLFEHHDLSPHTQMIPTGYHLRMWAQVMA